MELTKQDIQVLLEAIDVWIRKDFAGNLMGSLMGSLICGNNPKSKAEFEEKEKELQAKAEAEKQCREEQAIGLKAKLLSLRDSLEADAFVESATQGKGCK